MADIRPFSGLRYNLSKSGDLASLVAPPYDVISPEAQRDYHARNEYNIIRLELGLEHADDTTEHNKYTRAAELYRSWRKDGILVPEPRPSIYVYEQEFEHKGQRKVRRGLVACLKLEDWDSGVVLPHEETLAKPLADRFHLMCACHANFSPIFGLYEDNTREVARILNARASDIPASEVYDEHGEAHRLWIIGDTRHLHELHKLMRDAQVFIADGHHRYQTALRYRDRMREMDAGFLGDEAFNFVMILMVDLEDPGLVVLPTHRMLRSPGLDAAVLEQKLQKYFRIEHRTDFSEDQIEPLLAEIARTDGPNVVFGAYGLRPDTFAILILDKNADLDEIMPREHSRSWKELDVSVLHSLVLEHIMDVKNVGSGDDKSIAFIRDEREALHAVRNGEYSLSFFVNPPSVAQIRAIALAGDKMPQKSTYFHPKPLTGLVINPLDVRLLEPKSD